MTTALQPAYAGLASLVGESRVVTDPTAYAAYPVDGKTPQCVVYAPGAEQVAAVLRYASDHNLAVIPVRNATKISTGNPPRRYDVALSLKEMNRVWYYEPDDLTVSVEPGMKLGDFQHLLSRHNLWLPVDPPGGEKSSIGGILATNALGPLRLGYGAPRDFSIGMKIATAEGKIVKTGGRVVKNVAGYDIAKLMIGSYGTLGVIVEASFKLFPLPAATTTFVLECDTLDRARELRRALARSPLEPLRAALLGAEFLDLLRHADSPEANEGWQIWLEAGGSAKVLDRYQRELAELARRTGARMGRLSDTENRRLWGAITDRIDVVTAGFATVLKASLPISATEEFIGRAQRMNESRESVFWAYPAAGVVHVGLKLPETSSSTKTVEGLRALARELGGSLIVESAPLEVKTGVDTWGPPGDDFEMMRKMKAAWDPKGILAPGRFLGGL